MSIESVTGIVAPPAALPARPRAPLGAPKVADKGALEFETGFLTPLAAIELATGKPNTLLPVRILGRSEAGQPWRLLAQAQAEFDPIQLAFVATGKGPFELALGHPAGPPAAVALSTLASALGQRKLQDLPQAPVGAAQRGDPQRSSVFGWIAPGKPAVLWIVLIAGVLILGAVAWTLLRQLKLDAPKG